MIYRIPHELMILITYFMDTQTFCNIRRVYRIDWYSKKVKQYSKFVLEKLELESSGYPSYGNTLNFQKKNRISCTHCGHKTMRFIEWSFNQKRPYIPWCVIHVYGPVMDSVECYAL